MRVSPSEAPDRAIEAAIRFHNGEQEGVGVKNIELIDNFIHVEWFEDGDEWEPIAQTEEQGISEIGQNLPDLAYTQALPRDYERIADERGLAIE
jgi:hypothetical protein